VRENPVSLLVCLGAGRNHARVAGTRVPAHDIESHSEMRSARGGHRAAAPGGEPGGNWRREGPHNDESVLGAVMRAWSGYQVVAGPMLQSTGRNRLSLRERFIEHPRQPRAGLMEPSLRHGQAPHLVVFGQRFPGIRQRFDLSLGLVGQADSRAAFEIGG
jgi:hypothetical protein